MVSRHQCRNRERNPANTLKGRKAVHRMDLTSSRGDQIPSGLCPEGSQDIALHTVASSRSRLSPTLMSTHFRVRTIGRSTAKGDIDS